MCVCVFIYIYIYIYKFFVCVIIIMNFYIIPIKLLAIIPPCGYLSFDMVNELLIDLNLAQFGILVNIFALPVASIQYNATFQ